MTTTLLQAAVGAGKTEAALERLTAVVNDTSRPFARIWVLLATRRQEVAFRQRLTDLKGERVVYFNTEFFNFYTLNARVLNLAGEPQRLINASARTGLLRKVILDADTAGQLPVFSSIAQTSGFVRVLGDLIDELKQNRVFPEDYHNAVETQKDRELAWLYERYQTLLRENQLVDNEGEGWVALEAMQEDRIPPLGVDLLLVDGYDQFSPTQAGLLAQLSRRIPDVVVTLTQPPGSDEDDPQRSIGRRFVQAAQRLRESHDAIGVDLHTELLVEPKIEKHIDLLTLGRNIFSDVAPIDVRGGLHMIEAPEIEQEVAAVLRDAKRRMLDGVRPDDILIALRDWGRYYNFFEIYRRFYELPLLLHYGAPMAQNPVIVTLMDLLALPSDDPNGPMAFRRRDLLDVLRSPYLAVPGLDTVAVDLLDRISREKQVLAGRQNWLDAIDSAGEDYYDEDGERYPALLSLDAAMNLHTDLDTFFTQTAMPPQGTLSDYVQRLEDLIGPDPIHNPEDDPAEDEPQPHESYTLNIPRCIRAISERSDVEHLINRDAVALNQFKDLLSGMLSTQEFLRSALQDQVASTSWASLFSSIRNSIENERPRRRNPTRSGRVLVTTAAEARGLPHDHVYVLGLSEGIFPAQVPEDPLYLPDEILRLREQGVFLQTPDERTDDNGIFYELISLPRTALTLSRPTVREGKPWVESHLWRMTRAVFAELNVHELGIGDVVATDTATSLDEARIAVAAGLSDGTLSEDEAGMALYDWLSHDDEQRRQWAQIVHGRSTEAQRQSPEPYNSFSGRLQHPDLIAVVRDEMLTDNKIWSASQMRDYGVCGYRYFAKRLLRLEALEEPQEGLDALQLGTLNHAILEATYNEIRQAGMTIEQDNRADALDILDDVAEPILRIAPEKYKFRESALWRQERELLLRRLRALVEADFSPSAPLNQFAGGEARRPFALEMNFGLGDEEPVTIPIGQGQSLRVRGSIDRVDLAGDKLIVVDYKTGTSPISKREMQAGRHFQMMVYLLALEQMLAEENLTHTMRVGAFWHIRNLELSGVVDLSDVAPQQAELVAAGQAFIADYIVAARAGDFSVQPSKIQAGKCFGYCEYYQLCRLASTHQYKHKF